MILRYVLPPSCHAKLDRRPTSLHLGTQAASDGPTTIGDHISTEEFDGGFTGRSIGGAF